jgi:hypothetical protein
MSLTSPPALRISLGLILRTSVNHRIEHVLSKARTITGISAHTWVSKSHAPMPEAKHIDMRERDKSYQGVMVLLLPTLVERFTSEVASLSVAIFVLWSTE